MAILAYPFLNRVQLSSNIFPILKLPCFAVRKAGVSANFLFVLSHELAHIYINEENIENKDIELTCDCSAVYNHINKIKKLNLGVFESMLFNSLISNESHFWGKIYPNRKEQIKKRYEILSKINNRRSFKKSKCHKLSILADAVH